MYEKTPMDRQAEQAVADFVEEMEEIYPELADTGLEPTVHAAIQNLRDRQDEQNLSERSL